MSTKVFLSGSDTQFLKKGFSNDYYCKKGKDQNFGLNLEPKNKTVNIEVD